MHILKIFYNTSIMLTIIIILITVRYNNDTMLHSLYLEIILFVISEIIGFYKNLQIILLNVFLCYIT